MLLKNIQQISPLFLILFTLSSLSYIIAKNEVSIFSCGPNFIAVLFFMALFNPIGEKLEHNSRAMQLSRLTDRLEHDLRKRIFAVLGEKMIDYLDMLPALRQTIARDQGNPFFESRNGHFDASGYGVIARSVALH